MLGAVENKKYTYVLNRDAEMKLTISSPLESNKASLLTFCMVGVDVGFDNPIFACLEMDCHNSDTDHTGQAYKNLEKVLTYYELDLGLNHIVRKWTDVVEMTANHLVAIPGEKDGPSGVLVCSEGIIEWRHPDHERVRLPIPKRDTSSDANNPERGNSHS